MDARWTLRLLEARHMVCCGSRHQLSVIVDDLYRTAEQMDVHEGTATVREAMRFSAYLRQPFVTPIEEKDQYVEELIDLLELQDLSEALVFSLAMEARKRLTIGVELASKPELLLFLDEVIFKLDISSELSLTNFFGSRLLDSMLRALGILFDS